MATAVDYRRHVRRPVGFVVLGALLLVLAAGLLLDSMRRKSHSTVVDQAYSYDIKQSIDQKVFYFQNSFYENGPENNDGYVMDLTDKIGMTFHYDFKASEVQNLSYAYEIRAVLRGKYLLAGTEKDASNVWTKEFQLLKPVLGVEKTDKLSFSPRVEVPYVEYKAMIDQLRAALSLIMESDVTVTFSVRVTGDIGGAKLDDIRTSTVVATIGPQIYALKTKYEPKDFKQIVPVATQAEIDKTAQIELYVAVAIVGLAVASFGYGLRKQIFKTPYQRELDRIYRYHDGIIVRAHKQTEMTGKHIVEVKSFDDMLNLEEGLKLPLVATTIGPEATRFTIMRNDVVYAYTLGTPPRRVEPSLEQIEEAVSKKIDGSPKRKVPRKIQ